MTDALPPARPLRRILAYAADSVVLYVYIILLYLASVSLDAVLPFHHYMADSYLLRHGIAFLTLSLPTVAYFALMEHSGWQATFGKRLLKLRVVGADMERASLTQLVVRNGVKFLPWELAHVHMHIHPEYVLAGETTPIGIAFGVVFPLALGVMYVLMIFFRSDHRAPYEHASRTQVVHLRPPTTSPR